MRAIRYEGPQRGVVLDRAAPEPAAADGQAIVRPTRVAIGPVEIEFASGKPASPPITIGRWFVGVVESAGKGNKDKSLVGKRVVAGLNCPCGVCERCKGGLSMHCAARTVLGVRGRDGCFADLVSVPVASLIAVPQGVDDDAAMFAEPLASALHAAQQLRLAGKAYVTVLGDGVAALLCAQVMAQLNASVRVLGTSERRLELAAKWGVKHRHEREAGKRGDQDVVIDCTGTASGLTTALALVRPRGKVLVKGTPSPGAPAATPLDLAPIAQHEVEVIGSRCGPVSEGVARLARGDVDVVSLISARDKFDRGVEALRAAASSPDTLAVALEL